MSVQAHALTEDHAHDHGHHHKETFVTKYIFSQDHKIIARQFLITGIFWAVISFRARQVDWVGANQTPPSTAGLS